MTTHDRYLVEGTFEFIEAKIRRDAEGTAFGGDFEWLCKWFLKNAPRYRGEFDKVWLWKDWPDRWGTDAGIDIVARTRSGELWAIQAKADHPDRATTKREIDSFLSESNRSQFAYRLLMATSRSTSSGARRNWNSNSSRWTTPTSSAPSSTSSRHRPSNLSGKYTRPCVYMTDDSPTDSTNCGCRWGEGRINLPNAADDRSCGNSALARRASEWDNPENAIYDDWKQLDGL